MAIKRKDPGAEEQGTSGVGGAVSAGGSSQAGGLGRDHTEDELQDLRDVNPQHHQHTGHKHGHDQQGGKADPNPKPAPEADANPAKPRK